MNIGSNNRVMGVDGCSAGWIAILYDPKTKDVNWQFSESVHELANEDVCLLGIDIPIISRENEPRRESDHLARELLGPKRSSVFFAPSRVGAQSFLQGKSYEETNELLEQSGEHKLSKQTWCIMPKISQVDEYLLSQDSLDNQRIFELHPELIYHMLHQNTSRNPEYLLDKKRTETGRNERIRMLVKFLERDKIMGLLEVVPRKIAQPDDVLDALILAVFMGCAVQNKIPIFPPYNYASYIKNVFDLRPALEH